MPELPEMEHYRQALLPLVTGKTMTGVTVEREKTINVPVSIFTQIVLGNRITAIDRRAKHLLFQLASGHALHLHLMLGGSMFFGTEEEKLARTAQVTLSFSEQHLYFHGLRLGYLHLQTQEELREEVAKLGPDPFDPQLSPERFREILRSRRGSLKVTLVDQAVISGIGNCYSDEICFAARLIPLRKITDLSDEELNSLYGAMRSVLAEATRFGGYMDVPLYTGDALTGGYDSRCAVYDRENEPCIRCGSPIVRTELSSRKCFYCAGCQH